MLKLVKTAALTAALGGVLMVGVAPAQAQHQHHRGKKHDVVGAVLLGVLTVAAVVVVAGGDDDDEQRCDGGRIDPDFCYGGRDDDAAYPAGQSQGGYAQSGQYENDQDDSSDGYRQDRQVQGDVQYEDGEQADEYEQDDQNRGW